MWNLIHPMSWSVFTFFLMELKGLNFQSLPCTPNIWSYGVMGLDQVAVGVQLTQLIT